MKPLKEFLKSAQFMFVMPIIVMTFVTLGFISHVEHAHAQSPTQALSTQTTAAHDAVSALAAAGEQQIADGLVQQASQQQQILALTSTNTSLASQIQTLQSTFTFRDMEWVSWHTNCNSQVGGSGNGVGLQNSAPGAYFAITPTPPAAGAVNYFDCYYTWDAAPDESKTHFRYTLPWTFPTQADANASQCLEMEIRQSMKSGLMAVWALQLQFSGKQLRIWDHSRAWFTTGTALPRFTPGTTYTVTLEGHRDDTTAFYDAITINQARIPLSYSYPMWNMGWRSMMRVAAQLDGNGSGTAYRVNRGKTEFTSW